MHDDLTAKVREAWNIYSAQNREDRELTDSDKETLNEIFEGLSSYGFNITNDLHLFHIYDNMFDGYGEFKQKDDDLKLWASVVHLRDNVKKHADVFSPSGKHLSAAGDGYILTRFSYDDNNRRFFEAYVFDKGEGFPNDNESKPQIEKALQKGVSLSSAGECGDGLLDALEDKDFWEIECKGYRLRKNSSLEKLLVKPIKGVMVHIVKYIPIS